MSIGNTKTQGNQGKNFPYQLRNLQLLEAILSTLNASITPVERTPSLVRVNDKGLIPSGTIRLSVINSGKSDGGWLTTAIKPGEKFDYSVNQIGDVLGEFAYDATGTEFAISYVS